MDDQSIPFILEGQVVKTDDPDQMGRVKVWVPSLDGESFEIESLPWADYASPLAGFTTDYPAGGDAMENDSHSSYGFWAIPKMGATVLIFCLEGDPTRRFYFASTLRLHRNRSLPAGRNFDGKGQPGPWGDAGDGKGSLNKIEPAYSNLREQFQNKLTESEAKTRGVYERQAAQQAYNKDGTEGYSKTPITNETYLDSQMYCFVTPGRHALIFQDDPTFARLRIKTGGGHQFILDDANERIYMSTNKGKSWLEMDSDGHCHAFGAASYSVRAGVDINLFADQDINMEAGRSVNIKAVNGAIRQSAKTGLHMFTTGDAFISACGDIHANSEKAIFITSATSMNIKAGIDMTLGADRGLDIKAAEIMKLQAGRIDLNGPAARVALPASCATPAEPPSVVPGHEPWKRPLTKGKRGKNWKP
jgi:hypothetical protein